MFGSGDPNVHFNFQVGLKAHLEERFESHDSNNVRCGQIEYLITAFSERWLIDFGVADIASCLGQETQTFI
jgi:hypothetical protein